MSDMTIVDFCDKHNACESGRAWAKLNCPSGMMSEAYEKLSNAVDEAAGGYFDWVWCRAFDDKTLRLLAVRMTRETPFADGWNVVDLLANDRSIDVLTVAKAFAKAFANETASKKELNLARDAAWAATRAAFDAARVVQHNMVLSLGNPFINEVSK